VGFYKLPVLTGRLGPPLVYEKEIAMNHDPNDPFALTPEESAEAGHILNTLSILLDRGVLKLSELYSGTITLVMKANGVEDTKALLNKTINAMDEIDKLLKDNNASL
jgi:hypothetical protein